MLLHLKNPNNIKILKILIIYHTPNLNYSREIINITGMIMIAYLNCNSLRLKSATYTLIHHIIIFDSVLKFLNLII